MQNVGMNEVKIVGVLEKIVEIHGFKKKIVLFCVYKMTDISKKTWEKVI